MTRRLEPGDRLVLATHNSGKLAEIADLLRPHHVAAVSVAELGLAEPEETETSFEGNARLKALAAARGSGLPALADDSGFCVAALDGAPGIFSARWAGPARDFAAAMRRVEHEIGGAGDRRAEFVCVLCLAWPEGKVPGDAQVFEGRIAGQAIWPTRGGRGFGYDPMFVPDGWTESFGEMAPDAKHAISHRARAFAAFAEACLPRIREKGP